MSLIAVIKTAVIPLLAVAALSSCARVPPVKIAAPVPAAPTAASANSSPPISQDGPKASTVAPKVPLDGVIFNLPRTLIQLDLTVERTSQKAGEFCEFNDLFWPGVKETVKCGTEPPPEILATGAVFSTRGTADPNRRFVLPLGTETAIDSTDSLDLAESGVVSGVDSSRTDRRGEFALSIVSALAGVAGKLLGAGSGAVPEYLACESKDKNGKAVVDLFCKEFLSVQIDNSDATILREQFSWLPTERQAFYKGLYSNRADAKHPKLIRARRAFVTSMDLLSAQTKLLGRELPTGFSGVADIVKINKEEVAKILGSSFLGAEKKLTWSPSFELLPKDKDIEKLKVKDEERFTLYTKYGKCVDSAGPHLSKGNIIPELKCTATDKTGTPSQVKLVVSIEDIVQMAKIAGDYYGPPSQTSYPFAIPAQVQLAIVEEGNALATPPAARALLAQWGSLHFIPVGRSAKGKNVKLTYYEATGALKSIKFGSESAFNKGLVDSLAGSANAVLDGKLKADAAADAEAKKAGDELLNLQRRRQILEETQKIQKICAELGISCSN